MTAITSDWYSVLGISPDAGQDEVTRAYHQRAKSTHPDRGGDPEEFLQVRRAWEILGDPDTRSRYDTIHTRNPGNTIRTNDTGNPDDPADPGGTSFGMPDDSTSWTETSVEDVLDWTRIPWGARFDGIAFDDPRVRVHATVWPRVVRWIALVIFCLWWWPGMVWTRHAGESVWPTPGRLAMAGGVATVFPILAIVLTLVALSTRVIRATVVMGIWTALSVAVYLPAHPGWAAAMAGWFLAWVVLGWGRRLTGHWTLWPRRRIMAANVWGAEDLPPDVDLVADALARAIPAARIIWHPRGADAAVIVDRKIAYLGLRPPAGRRRWCRVWDPIDVQDLTGMIRDIGEWLLRGSDGLTVNALTLAWVEYRMDS